MICPQTSAKLVGGYGTAVDHVLAMAFDDPSMDDDLRRALDAHEVMLDGSGRMSEEVKRWLQRCGVRCRGAFLAQAEAVTLYPVVFLTLANRQLTVHDL